MWLLDTVAISEARKADPNPGFLSWLEGVADRDLHTSVLCLGEIRRGIALMASGKRREQLAAWLANDLPAWFGARIHAVDAAVALAWGELGARAAAKPIDTLIGATARVHGLSVVTRNVRDFDGLGVPVVNPWSPDAG